MPAPLGKHAKITEPAVIKHGKHAGVVNITRNYSQIVFTLVLALLIIVVPFSFNKLLVAMDNKAASEASYTSRSLIADVQPDAVEVETAQAVNVGSPDNLLAAAQIVAHIPVVDYAEKVEPKLQVSIMPSGCELISLDIVLHAMGLDPDIDSIVTDHLVIDGHFGTGYSGDPYYSGGGYPQGIVNATNGYLASVGSPLEAHDITGATFELLQAYIAKGYPVLVWTTISYEDPVFTGAYDESFEWYLNEHCVVMYGFDGVQVLISDPLEGLMQLDEERFIELFTECGSMAAVIY